MCQKFSWKNFWTKTELTKLRPHPPSPGWSPTIPRLVTHHPKDSHPSNSTRSLTLAQPSLLLFNLLCFLVLNFGRPSKNFHANWNCKLELGSSRQKCLLSLQHFMIVMIHSFFTMISVRIWPLHFSLGNQNKITWKLILNVRPTTNHQLFGHFYSN